MLDKQRHEAIMKNILRDLYTHPQLQAQLAFKGGTCLYLLHELPRFSTDLDFSLTTRTQIEELNVTAITEVMQKYLDVDDHFDKHFTWFWVGSYEKGKQKIKLEISKRRYQADHYTHHDLFGLTIKSLDLSTLAAHKLCALTDRQNLVNRDLYDTWWLLKKMFPINKEIISERTGKSLGDYLRFTQEYIDKHVDPKHILLGLGEVLTEPQKDWVRDHLLNELSFQIKLNAEADESK
jgi:predicted nucleotidyltransferase component of viral defense system